MTVKQLINVLGDKDEFCLIVFHKEENEFYENTVPPTLLDSEVREIKCEQDYLEIYV